MKLLIISHTAHYLRDGTLVGWGPTVKEINWLAPAFDKVIHLACFHQGIAPESSLPYTVNNLRLELVPPSGGLTMLQKLRTLWLGPKYLWQILRLLPKVDVVHVRCPGSLGLYGMIAVSLSRKKKWAKYAGNWIAPRKEMPPSHFFQRWWLRAGLSHGPVTVNGRWPNQPAHVHTFLNPSLSLNDVQQASELVRKKELLRPVQIIFAGHTSKAKGLDTALSVVRQLYAQYGNNIKFDIVGGGDEQPLFIQCMKEAGLEKIVTFHGWLPHSKVLKLMTPAHFILLPSKSSEGWPKVLSEAMTYGVVPIASDVSAIPQILSDTKAGISLPADEVLGFVNAISQLIDKPDQWREMSKAGLAAAPLFTYERYLIAVDELFSTAYGQSPLEAGYTGRMRQKFAHAAQDLPRQFWLERT